MNKKDQQLLEEAYQQITRQGGGRGTELRPNYSFSQIDKEAWRGDNRFQGVDIKFPDKQSWEAHLKFDGKDIHLQGKDREVSVDGKPLDSSDRLNLRQYIIKNYASTERSGGLVGSKAFTGKGEPVKESVEDYSTLSDSKLLDLYKTEFDKQFEGKEDKAKLKKVLSAIKSRSQTLTNKAHSYAVHKTEMER
jgi:hypothetical protein